MIHLGHFLKLPKPRTAGFNARESDTKDAELSFGAHLFPFKKFKGNGALE
jgi:hypothetical protein